MVGGGVGVGFFTPPSAPGTEDTVYVFSNGKPYEFDKTKNVDKTSVDIGTSNPLSDAVKYLGGSEDLFKETPATEGYAEPRLDPLTNNEVVPNEVTWSSVINAWAKQGNGEKAEQCLERMIENEVVPNKVKIILIKKTPKRMKIEQILESFWNFFN